LVRLFLTGSVEPREAGFVMPMVRALDVQRVRNAAGVTQQPCPDKSRGDLEAFCAALTGGGNGR
jgi:hypothetical protein